MAVGARPCKANMRENILNLKKQLKLNKLTKKMHVNFICLYYLKNGSNILLSAAKARGGITKACYSHWVFSLISDNKVAM